MALGDILALLIRSGCGRGCPHLLCAIGKESPVWQAGCSPLQEKVIKNKFSLASCQAAFEGSFLLCCVSFDVVALICAAEAVSEPLPFSRLEGHRV